MKNLFTVISLSITVSMNAQDKFYPSLAEYCTELAANFNSIPQDRKPPLEDLVKYILEVRERNEPVQLTFICTHNSRRSHMAQLWAAAGAAYYGVQEVHCFSGGTEATAFNKSAIDAMERAGFKITKVQVGKNPVYEAKLSATSVSIRMWSKKYDDALNPSDHFAAVMVCSDADKNCPFVLGAETRIAIPFEDPKAYDGTPSEGAKYDERCKQIGTEMLYVMSLVKEAQIKGK